MKIQNFLMWFKNGLKAQKLLAQGSALGIIAFQQGARYGQKLYESPGFKAFALTGRQVCGYKKPRALPWARSFCPFYYICTWKNKEVKIFISANFC